MSSFKYLNGIGQPESETVCDRMWLLLSVYSDGEASPEETADVETHVEQCKACAAELAMMRANSGVLAATAEVQPPAALRTAILAATVYRPSFTARLAQALRANLVAHPARLGALATAGAAAVLALTVMNRRPAEIPVPIAFTQQPPAVYAQAPTRTAPAARTAPETPRSAKHIVSAVSKHRAPAETDRLELAEAAHVVTAVIRKPEGAARVSRPATPPTVKVAATIPVYKVKLPTASPSRDATETPDSAESAPMEVASAGGMGTPAKPNSPAVATPEASAPAPVTRITLAASASGIPVDQMASLAAIKENLRRQKPAWDTRSVAQSIKDRQIRIDLIRGSF